MKIVWRNPNPINRTSFSIVKTLAVEQPDELRVFYRSSRGPGALAPYLSYRSTVTRSLARHDPNVNHSVSFVMPTRSQHRAARSFTPLQARNESQSRKRSSRRHLLRRHRSRRGELPGSGVTSSTPTARVRAYKTRPEPSSQPRPLPAADRN